MPETRERSALEVLLATPASGYSDTTPEYRSQWSHAVVDATPASDGGEVRERLIVAANLFETVANKEGDATVTEPLRAGFFRQHAQDIRTLLSGSGTPPGEGEADDLLRKLILQVCDAAVLQAGFPDDAPEPDRSIIDRRREIAENVAGYALEVEPPPALVELRKLIAAPVPAREGEEPDLLEAAMQGVLVAEALEELYERLKMSAKDRKAFSAEMAQIMAELEPTRTAIDAARLRGEGGGR